jgi:hypothetical protein
MRKGVKGFARKISNKPFQGIAGSRSAGPSTCEDFANFWVLPQGELVS